MPPWIGRVIADLKERRNIELYLLLLVGGTVLIVDLFDFATTGEALRLEVVFNTILAVLLLLAFGMLGERRNSEEIAAKLDEISGTIPARSFFSEWNNSRFQEELNRAKSVSILAVASYVNFRENEETYKALLDRGGRIECILVSAGSDAARMESQRSPGILKIQEPEYLTKQIDLSVQTLRDIAEMSKHPELVTLKFVDQLPPAIITIINRKESDAVAFITLNGFKQSFATRPSFILSRTQDGKWFHFYSDTFDKLWNWSECKVFSLGKTETTVT